MSAAHRPPRQQRHSRTTHPIHPQRIPSQPRSAKRSREFLPCIFPASGFYEWKHEHGRTFPYYLFVRGASLFGCAGLYDRWTPPGSNEEILTCVMVTCLANALVNKIHGRMPAIIAPPLEGTWLRGEEGYLSSLEPYPAEKMRCHRVDGRVNSPVNDDPALIRPAEADHGWW